MTQAEQYETGGDAWDTVLKLLNTVMRTHPFHTVRAAELLQWQRSGQYDTIIAGDYLRRGDEGRSAAQRGLRRRRRLLRRRRHARRSSSSRTRSAARATPSTPRGNRISEGSARRRRRPRTRAGLAPAAGRSALTLFAAPGNPGIAELATCLPIAATDVRRTRQRSRGSERVDLDRRRSRSAARRRDRRSLSRRRAADLRTDARRRADRNVEGVREAAHDRRGRARRRARSPARTSRAHAAPRASSARQW